MNEDDDPPQQTNTSASDSNKELYPFARTWYAELSPLDFSYLIANNKAFVLLTDRSFS